MPKEKLTMAGIVASDSCRVSAPFGEHNLMGVRIQPNVAVSELKFLQSDQFAYLTIKTGEE